MKSAHARRKIMEEALFTILALTFTVATIGVLLTVQHSLSGALRWAVVALGSLAGGLFIAPRVHWR